MAASRERRSNAGNRMSRLLQEEDQDEFYTTTYGGFNEEEEDADFSGKSGAESESTDSDFSNAEEDEQRSDAEDVDADKGKRKAPTKFFKEPKPKIAAESDSKTSEPQRKKKRQESIQVYRTATDRKHLRTTTAAKSAATAQREKDRQEKDKMMKELAARKNVTAVRRLTQEELLAEAKITEEINTKSLEAYQRLELERKKTRFHKQGMTGPFIRYHSVTMPLLAEQSSDADPSQPPTASSDVNKKCSRTFITFSDDVTWRNYFGQAKKRNSLRLMCPITKQPARYYDPITLTPYSTIAAFRCLREALHQQLTNKNSDTPIVVDQRIMRQHVLSSAAMTQPTVGSGPTQTLPVQQQQVPLAAVTTGQHLQTATMLSSAAIHGHLLQRTQLPPSSVAPGAGVVAAHSAAAAVAAAAAAVTAAAPPSQQAAAMPMT